MRSIIRAAIAAAVLSIPVSAFAQVVESDPKDPQYRHTGEQSRTYAFPETGETIPYHLYVPMKWTTRTRLPLVVVTHGAAQPATAPFQRPMTNPTLARAAEERGYIVAAVTGYHANATGVGGWNVPYPMVQVPRQAGAGGGRGGRSGEPPAPPTATDFQRAEQDVLHVTDLVAKEYNVDADRIYLMGNSSGGGAVWA